MTTPPSGPTLLRLRNDLAEIDTLAAALEQFGVAHRVAPEIINVVNLALEEIITNIISYGFADSDAHTIEVALDCQEGHLSATVEDDGEEFDPLQKEEPDLEAPLEERRIGGLGVHLVRTLMDEVTYTRRNGRNVLFIRKATGTAA